ncbi:hypothetical protein BT96DRAFT_1013525 [Gymnopus androsaceus JB14]|uniref:AIG1-type G domain-containing protein n=1 Tax=Gymnopus androsaceus JB14 TaxID=1447944 RepID=A0A6A4I8U4_9AGAR|nr:hypothetical protein BT96DRAFT_1013525 [Gymnopus androsaceus JB14]
MAAHRPQVSIILMGGTGTGKTTFANLAGGSHFVVGEGLESCTQHVQCHRFAFGDKDVALIDVPGFDDTSKSDIDILTIIADFLVKEQQEHRSLSGILYFHRISDVRMGGAARRNFTMFQKLCGDDAFKNVAIVTTRWDQEEAAIAEARFAELESKPQLFKSILDSGGKIFKHDRTPQSVNEILTHLISKDATSLLIQREIVDEHKELAETAAGQELYRDIVKQMEKHQKELADLIDEMEQTREDSELKDLEVECLELRDRMTHWYAESEKLANAGRRDPPLTSEIRPRLALDSSGYSSPQAQALINRAEEPAPGNGQRDRQNEQFLKELQDIRAHLRNIEGMLVDYPFQLVTLMNRVFEGLLGMTRPTQRDL